MAKLVPTVYRLSGVRSSFETATFPALRPRLCAYLQISAHRGVIPCNVQIFHVETDEIVYQSAPKTVGFNGPLVIVPVVFRIRNCVFPSPGLYYVMYRRLTPES